MALTQLSIVNDSLVKYTVLHGTHVGVYSNIPFNGEIIDKFIKNHNIIVKWINCNYSYGSYDDETGKWTGAVGQVNIHYDISLYNIFT